MDPIIISTILLVALTVISVFLFKKLFFKFKNPEELFDKNASEFDKALMTKDPDIAIYKHRRYFSSVAGFITMIFIVAFVEYPIAEEEEEEKVDQQETVSQTVEVEVTEQKPEKPKPKSQKPRREEVVEKPIERDSTEQEELKEFVPDFSEDEDEDEEDEEEDVAPPPLLDRPKFPAEFPGGRRAFTSWIYNNLKVPEVDKQNRVKGMIMVEFVVYEDGFVRDIKILKSINAGLDAAVKELFESSPKWKPARSQGTVVRQRRKYPIRISPK